MKSPREWAEILMAEELDEWKRRGIGPCFIGTKWWSERVTRIQSDASKTPASTSDEPTTGEGV